MSERFKQAARSFRQASGISGKLQPGYRHLPAGFRHEKESFKQAAAKCREAAGKLPAGSRQLPNPSCHLPAPSYRSPDSIYLPLQRGRVVLRSRFHKPLASSSSAMEISPSSGVGRISETMLILSSSQSCTVTARGCYFNNDN